MIKDKNVNLKVSQQYFEKIKSLADNEGMTIPDFVRTCLEEGKAKRERPKPLLVDPLLSPQENESQVDAVKRIDRLYATAAGRELLSERRKYFLEYYAWPPKEQLTFD